MFPPDLCKELEHLHNHAPMHPLAHTRAAIQGAFSNSLGDLFEEFEEEPVASGSIAQVYRGRLSTRGALHTGFEAGKCHSVMAAGAFS